ncbi:hypothetical protein COLO4_34813 [Corchorus olitorius]|uniref:BHLH domain-containing protein n=1 Tax=Corchorus olitorius TaxID=93759 RepID=A0A1R3GJG7_9ROSI|nr:hypothetical protein COLO4_34813 [Corchorus olitorius]
MNRGVLQSSPVQQMMAGINPNWWSINTMRPPPTHQQPLAASPFFPPPPLPPPAFFPQYTPTSSSSSSSSSSLPNIPSWHDNNNQDQLPESWSQLLLGGLVGEDEKGGMGQFLQAQGNKKMENWEQEQALHQASINVEVKQENSASSYVNYGHHANNEDFETTTTKPTWSHQVMPVSSPKSSCVTSFSSNMLDFSGNKATDHARHPPPDRSSECNSTATGGAMKKARVQPSATQSTFKVRKEKLGDRITALHQLVSPFGKTDTASVLLEAIGYIRFLQSQIEALSLPYLGTGSSGNIRQQQSVRN